MNEPALPVLSLIVPVKENDDWSGFWDRLLPLKTKVKRWKTRPAERRKPM